MIAVKSLKKLQPQIRCPSAFLEANLLLIYTAHSSQHRILPWLAFLHAFCKKII